MRTASRVTALVPLLIATLVAAGCSNVRATYRASGYDALSKGAVKRIAVVAWAPQAEAGMGEVVAAVAADLIKLRKNYIVVQNSTGDKGRWSMACENNVQGVAVVRALRVKTPPGQKVELALSLELLRCSDGALLFRNEARGKFAADDSSLRELTATYESALGAGAATFAAPSFGLLQQMVAGLPDPVLDDHEVEEKIELGDARAPMPTHACARLQAQHWVRR